MPQETFFNLSQEKQERIIEAAVKEFSKKGYTECSIETVAKQAGVAKGSMYQYFENKKELFFYILQIAASRKTEIMADIIKGNPALPFFDLLKAMFEAGIRFAVEHPELNRIFQDIQKKAPREIQEEFNEKTGALAMQYYTGLIKMAVENGDIRDDISVDLISYVFYSFVSSFGNFLLERCDLTSGSQCERYVKDLIELIKNGAKS